MKAIALTFLFVLPLTLMAGDVKLGDNSDSVRNAMGEPRGRARVGERELLCYDRGEIELISGVVTRVALRSEADQANFETKRAAETLRLREERSRMIAAGEALKASKLADVSFQATPPSYQVAFWENFSRQYAGVPCRDELNLARVRLAEKEAAVREQAYEAQRLAELEARAAEDARRNRDLFYSPSHPFVYDRGYLESERRQRRLDRDYRDRISQRPSRDHTDQDTQGRYRDRTQANDRSLVCRPNQPGSGAGSSDDRSQYSSHTAMAFAGQNWLVWPSPAPITR